MTLTSRGNVSRWVVAQVKPWDTVLAGGGIQYGFRLELTPAPPEIVHPSAFEEGLANPDVGGTS